MLVYIAGASHKNSLFHWNIDLQLVKIVVYEITWNEMDKLKTSQIIQIS